MAKYGGNVMDDNLTAKFKALRYLLTDKNIIALKARYDNYTKVEEKDMFSTAGVIDVGNISKAPDKEPAPSYIGINKKLRLYKISKFSKDEKESKVFKNSIDAAKMRQKLLSLFKVIDNNIKSIGGVFAIMKDKYNILSCDITQEDKSIDKEYYLYGEESGLFYGPDDMIATLTKGIKDQMSKSNKKAKFGFGKENMWRVYYLAKYLNTSICDAQLKTLFMDMCDNTNEQPNETGTKELEGGFSRRKRGKRRPNKKTKRKRNKKTKKRKTTKRRRKSRRYKKK